LTNPALTAVGNRLAVGQVGWKINGLTERAAIRIFRPLSEFAPARPGFFVE